MEKEWPKSTASETMQTPRVDLHVVEVRKTPEAFAVLGC
jgi:hypothetical protein